MELTDYREQVALAARAVSVRSATSFEWFGVVSEPLAPWLRAELPPEQAREYLLDGLAHELYRSFYTRGQPVPRREGHDPGHDPDPGFVDALSAANASRGGWDPDWSVERTDGDQLRLIRDGLRVRAPAAACKRDGDRVSLRRARESRVVLPGFYVVHGDAPTRAAADAIETRVYFQLAPATAPTLVAELTQRLNAAALPFDLKLHAHPEAFTRPDAAVLYLRPGGFEPARPALRAVMDACALRHAPPPFTKPLGRGLAVGEHMPAHGLSFGTSRCRFLAEGLLDAHERGEHDLAARVAAVEHRFAAAGLDLDRPFLAPDSHDDYDL